MSDEARGQPRRKLVGWLLLPFALLIAGGVWFASERGVLRLPGALKDRIDVPQGEFEQRVRAYILDHPEVIAEAINRLEARRDEQAAKDAQLALKAHANEVFRDPNSPVGGNSRGDVTLVEFFDYNCPYCRAMAPLMAKAEAADPQLRIVYKEFPILGPGSVFAAKAALAASRQGKYVAFHRALYQARGQVDEAKVLEVAKAIGLDIERMEADMRDQEIAAELEKNRRLGEALHISGTPGFVVGDQVITGARDFAGLQALIAGGRQADPKAR